MTATNTLLFLFPHLKRLGVLEALGTCLPFCLRHNACSARWCFLCRCQFRNKAHLPLEGCGAGKSHQGKLHLAIQPNSNVPEAQIAGARLCSRACICKRLTEWSWGPAASEVNYLQQRLDILQAHPLVGMWKGDFGGHTGIQLMTISYDFSQRFAVIKANKASHMTSFAAVPLPD